MTAKNGRWRRLVWMGVRVYFGLGLILWAAQEALLFPGVWLPLPHTEEATWGEWIDAPRPGGTGVPLVLANTHHKKIVLLAHGNGESAGQMGAYAAALDSMEIAFAAVEYRGYAGVRGWPTEAKLTADVRAVVEELQRRGYGGEDIVFHGRSIGGGVIATALADLQPAGLVLESSFDSLQGVASSRFPVMLYPTSILLRSRFRTIDTLAGRTLPVLQVHDVTDSVVPFIHAKRLQAVLEDGTFIQTEGYPHGTPIVLRDGEAKPVWVAWLREVLWKAPAHP